MTPRFLVTETPAAYRRLGYSAWRVVDTTGEWGIVSHHKKLEAALNKTRRLNGSYTWRPAAKAVAA